MQRLINPAKPTGQAPLQREELHNLTYLLLVAGVGNIAILATCMMWALQQDPDWSAELSAELAGFEPAHMRNGLKSLPKLQATVAEAERCFLAAPVISKVTTKAIDVLGLRVPANTPVLQLIGMAHFDPQRYAQPDKFLPQRWLDPNTPRANAYGGGTHLCLGMGVSRVLLPLSLALLVNNHQLQLEQPPANIQLLPEINCSPTTTYLNALITGPTERTHG